MPLETANNDIAQITEGVFSSMLGKTLTRPRAAGPEDGVVERLTGQVQITGKWEGAVTIVVTRRLANIIATTMFGSGAGPAGDEEVRDALGEMANMVGGNFKSRLEPPVSLSLPAVTEGTAYRTFIPGSRLIAREDFACDGETLSVAVVARARSA